jgi:hypothetical protein
MNLVREVMLVPGDSSRMTALFSSTDNEETRP